MSPISLIAICAAALVGWPLFRNPRIEWRTFNWVLVGCWLAFAAWEQLMWSWRSPTGDRAIRVDALFLWPMMGIVFIVGLLHLFPARKSRGKKGA
jgi:hypothetical protein